MSKYLVVVDMQKDFVKGPLGTKEAQTIMPYVVERVKSFSGKVIFTRDTHEENYLETQEGKNLPIPHCIKGTDGWELMPEFSECTKQAVVMDKPTFGSLSLVEYLKQENEKDPITSIEMLGLCTDICVVSNALLLKAAFLDIPIQVDSKGCAGVSKEKHEAALEVMRSCQVEVK